MNDSKVIIHEFDPVVYPFKLWVIISSNLIEIENNFVTSKKRKKIDLSSIKDYHDAFVVNKAVIHDNKYGFLVVFNSKKTCIDSTIVHETTHLLRHIWEYLSEYEIGNEANAYLSEWIFNSIIEAKNFKK